MTRRKTGRLVKLTPEAVTKITAFIAAGVPMKFAAPHGGVSARAAGYWLAKGRKEKAGGVFSSFLASVKKAESEAVATRLLRINKAGQGGAVLKSTTTVTEPDGTITTTITEKASRPEWTADAWHLERTFPDQFGTGRQEIKELRRLLAEMNARIDQLPAAPPALPAPRKDDADGPA